MEITVSVRDVTDELQLKTNIGSFNQGNIKGIITTSIPAGSPLIGFEKEGKVQWFMVNMGDIIKGIIAEVKKPFEEIDEKTTLIGGEKDNGTKTQV